MGEKMTLAEVRDWLREAAKHDRSETTRRWYGVMADALDAHLTQPAQEVDRATIAKWRNDAFESAAQIVDRYAQHFPEVTGAADDIRALGNAQAVDVEKVREVIAELRERNEVPALIRASALAGKLTAAVTGKQP